MDKKEAIRLHREMWSWLAKTGEDKENWPEWEWNGGDCQGCIEFCFCCEYVFNVLRKDPLGKNICKKHCPLKWPDGRCAPSSELENKQGLYNLWCDETDIEKRKEYAEQIALLDERI